MLFIIYFFVLSGVHIGFLTATMAGGSSFCGTGRSDSDGMIWDVFQVKVVDTETDSSTKQCCDLQHSNYKM